MWVIFSLSGAALFSVTNFIEKFIVDKEVKDPLIIPIFQGFIFLFIGFLILVSAGFPLLNIKDLILLLLTGILLNYYLIPYFIALKHDDASRIVPLFRFIPVFVLILSYIFLNETLSQKQFFAFGIILLGSLILSVKKIKGFFTFRESLWLMILASLLYAISAVLYKFASVKQDFLVTLGYEGLGMGLGSILLLSKNSFRRRFLKISSKLTRTVWTTFSINALTSVAAQYCLFFSYRLAPVALGSVVESSQPVFVLIFGLFLSLFFPHIIKEEIGRATLTIKVISIGLIIFGIYLINF